MRFGFGWFDVRVLDFEVLGRGVGLVGNDYGGYSELVDCLVVFEYSGEIMLV